MPKIVAIEPCM